MRTAAANGGRGRPAWASPVAAAVAVAVVGCAAISPHGAEGRQVRLDEGRVVIAAGTPLLLDGVGGRAFVAPAPGASFTGISTLRELGTGDLVRYRWRREVGGVRLAERLDVEPVVATEPEFTSDQSELVVAIEQRRPQVIVDARAPSRFREGHLPRAVSAAADSTDSELLRAVSAGYAGPIVVYGEAPRDPSAADVARRLLAAGVRNVRVYRGGMRDWKNHDRWVGVSAESLRDRPMDRWLIVDVRPRERAAAARPAGAISVPPGLLKWQDFDGAHPLPPVLFVGSDGTDEAAAELADQLRQLRASNSVRTVVEFAVLEGGFEAWQRSGLPVEYGGALRPAPAYVRVERFEIAPDEFERLWASRGVADSGRYTFLDVRNSGKGGGDWLVEIALAELAARLHELPRDREILVFCAIGMRSQVAAELLRANGFRARFLRAMSDH